MFKRSRALFQLHPKEKCMGEEICTTDRVNGICARSGRSLEQICNEGGCKLFYTKKGITPAEFRGFLTAAQILRARAKGKLDLHAELMPYWAEQAYLTANAVYATVEAEENAADTDENGQKKETDFQVKGAGDSGAFSLINQHLKEVGARAKDGR